MTSGIRNIEDMAWWAYVQKRAKGESNSRIAQAVGVTPSSVSRWGGGSMPDPAQAAAFARAYGRPVLEAFVAAGFLTPQEARERPSTPPSIDDLTDEELLDEIRKRMLQGRSEGAAMHAAREVLGDSRTLAAPRPPSVQELKQQRLLEQAQPATWAADDRSYRAQYEDDDWEPR